MQERIQKSMGVFKTTAIGGLIFLLPLAVIGYLLGYVFQLIYVAYQAVEQFIPVYSAIGIAIVFLLSIALIVLLCFSCGLLAQRAIARQFSQKFEQQLTSVFPKYAIYKDILAGTIGGTQNAPTLQPVQITHCGLRCLAFESDRLSNGDVVVYMPGAPDTWLGSVVIVPCDQVQSLDVPFNEVLGIFERLGRKSSHHLNGKIGH